MKTSIFCLGIAVATLTVNGSFAEDLQVGTISHPDKKFRGTRQGKKTESIYYSAIHSLYRPVSEEAFVEKLEALRSEIDKDPALANKLVGKADSQAYQEYLQSSLDRAMGILVLSKILDDEGSRGNVPEKVNSAVPRYATRSILEQNAREMGLEPSDGNGSVMGDQELYQLFQNRVSSALDEEGRPISRLLIQFEWDYEEGGMKNAREILSRSNDLAPVERAGLLNLKLGGPGKAKRLEMQKAFWNFATLKHYPALKLSFSVEKNGQGLLPPTLVGFENLVQAEVQSLYRQIVRKEMWEDVVEEGGYRSVSRMGSTPNIPQMDVLYRKYLANNDPEAEADLKDPDMVKLLEKLYASENLVRLYREAMEDVFEKHPVVVTQDICNAFPEPCVGFGANNPGRWIKAIFSQTWEDLMIPKIVRPIAEARALEMIDRAMKR